MAINTTRRDTRAKSSNMDFWYYCVYPVCLDVHGQFVQVDFRESVTWIYIPRGMRFAAADTCSTSDELADDREKGAI